MLTINQKESQFIIAGYPLQNSEMIYPDKSNVSRRSSRITKSSKTSEVESTSKERDLSPYWEESVKAMSQRLWYPTETDWRDLDLNSLSGSVTKTKPKYWFSMKQLKNPRPVSQGTWFRLSKSLPVVSKDVENTKVKITKSIRIYPDANQRVILRKWFGVARRSYNDAVSYLKQPGTIANWKAIKTGLIDALPNWADEIPYQVKSIAIRDACKAVSNAKKKFIQTGVFNEVKHKSKKNNRQSCFIPKTAISEHGVYRTILGKIKMSESLPDIVCDSRLVLDKDRYFLKISTEVECNDNDNQEIIALDPGMRSFLTGFSPNQVIDFGKSAYSKILRLCYVLDNLISKRTKKNPKKTVFKTKARTRNKLRKAENRLRCKIEDLKKDMIHQVSSLLTKSFKYILIPTFNFHNMADGLFHKSVRALANLSHGLFREILKHHAKKNCAVVVELSSEAYTSKTCSCCGNIQEIGKAKTWKCCVCKTRHLRDVNGARGIFLRALRDASWLFNNNLIDYGSFNRIGEYYV